MDKDIVKIFEYLEKNHSRAAQDIYCGLELLTNSIGDCIDSISRDISIKSQTGDFAAISEIAELAEKIQNIRNYLNGYLDDFSMKLSVDDLTDSETIEEAADDERLLPNYSQYAVDTDIPHVLSEDFTYRKVCGFQFEGARYNVKTWQDYLVRLCELLVEKDRTIFETFPRQQAFRGRKNNYFSLVTDGKKYYRKLKNAEIYVWTNLCASLICEISKKVLRGYGLPINSVYIYLRADYTPLHVVGNETNQEIDESTAKIGKYVRDSLRKLSYDSYRFTDEELAELTSSIGTKKLFNKSIPLLKQVYNYSDISEQTKDSKGYNRYWKEIFEFNGNKYIVNSQWFEKDYENFTKWLNSLK